ncbi:hypothetical protein M0R45_005251 [Rubus argutus]|uniref:Protein kinase domain-containing protein n=1 Tax=Rubus argutus TaxID=59490 RepID=A0AAW1YMP2_RUBAR
MNSLTLSLYFLSLLVVSAYSASESELRSLYEFKKGIQTDPLGKVLGTWTDSSILTQAQSCPPWTGVLCNDGGNVVALALDGLGLGGELKFNTLTGLTALQNLTLANNNFSGRVPPVLGTMSSLQHLDLSGNSFYGPIPARINDLWGLNYLNLSRNLFKGGFSGRLSNLNQLKVFDVHCNKLWGDISDLLRQFHNVEYVDLSNNQFFGGISLSSDNLSSLSNTVRHLNFSHNNLTGGFFKADSIGLFRSLQVLDLGGNQITGKLPSFGSLPNLRVLRLANNQFVGEIPEELLESSIPIEELDLSGNGFTGSIIGINSTTLKVLNLSSNGNKISGDISIVQNMGAALEVLDLSSNKFSGSLPNLTLQFERLTTLSLRDNLLVGSLPSILKACPRLSTGGRVSEFLALPPDLPIESVDLSKNSLSGSLPRDLGNMVELRLLNLAKNDFSGELPSELNKLIKLEYLDLSGQVEFVPEIGKSVLPGEAATSSTSMNLLDNQPTTSGRKSSPGSPLSSSPRLLEAYEQPVILDVYSPDRLAGDLFFLDSSLQFTAEELSRAPAEVLGRSSHGTLYKATLDSGHMLTVKWLRVGLVKHKKDFAREVKRIGSIRHPNLVPLRAYYWGPREQERLLLADYIQGDSLALHLYESTPRRYSPLSFNQRLKVAVEVARCLLYLHDRGQPHGNLKPTNVILAGPEYHPRLTDYSLHRLMTPAGIAEQLLNMGALGYRAPELATAAKPVPSFKADVYALGVILMEMLTRRSAGDIISGQSGAVDLTDWVRLCDQEGRGMDCIDRDIASGEEPSKAMDELLAISLRCILPVNERPNIRQVFDNLCSISI